MTREALRVPFECTRHVGAGSCAGIAAGARKALADVGLHDEDAGKDVQELRGLLESWRDTKRTITQTIARINTGAVLFALAAGA